MKFISKTRFTLSIALLALLATPVYAQSHTRIINNNANQGAMQNGQQIHIPRHNTIGTIPAARSGLMVIDASRSTRDGLPVITHQQGNSNNAPMFENGIRIQPQNVQQYPDPQYQDPQYPDQQYQAW